MSDDSIKSFLEAIPLPAVFIGADGRMGGANADALKLNPQAGEPRAFILVFRQPGLSDAIETCLRTRAPTRAIYVHTEGAGGQKSRFDVSCRYVDADNMRGVLACFSDVTRQAQADQIRRDFVANVSHELRTPLTAILGFIETLQGPAREDTGARDRFLGTMAAEAGRMNRLVADLLSLSRVEEEARMRPTGRVDIDAVLRSVLSNLGPVAQDTGGTLAYDPAITVPDIPGDTDQITQVFTNLVENALKYGGQGTTVSLDVETVDRDRSIGGPALRIIVRDNGPGIDPLHIPRLTERFYRIDSHRSREMGGTGLGLAIVKHILNRHRGRLKVDSAPGKGSVFTVVLPLT